MYDCRVGIDGYFENIFVRGGGRKIGRKEGRKIGEERGGGSTAGGSI